MTNTEIALARLNSKFFVINIHIINTNRAIDITIGTNTKLILSASFAIGALELLATSTKSMIFWSVESKLSQVAIIWKLPLRLVVPPLTFESFSTKTGLDSPVKLASSTSLIPSITTPSIGICSPGFTISLSPTFISSTLISITSLSFSKWAFLGAKSSNCDIALVVLPFALFSINFPKDTKASIIPADSKYNSCL